MKKTALISLILACVMLAGCSLIVKDPQVDGARIVIDVNGESMNKQEFMEKYNSNVQLQRQMEELYRAYGMQAPAMSEEELLENTIDDIVRNKVLEQKAKEHKLDVLSEEENKEAEKEANTRWDNITAGIKSQFFKDSELSEKELNKAVEEKAVQEGYSKEDEQQAAEKNLVMKKLRDEIIKDVVVTSEEIKADYDSLVARDEDASKEDHNAYGKAKLNGQDFYYVPSGYRNVKQILVKFTEEYSEKINTAKSVLSEKQRATADAQSALDKNAADLEKEEDISDERLQELTDEKAKLQKQLDEAKQEEAKAQKEVDDALEQGYDDIKDKVNDIYERAASGEDFDALADEFNEDSGMPEEGYAVCDGFADFDKAFIEPAMALKNIGDVSKPSKGIYGYYIVQYAGDIKEGPVPMEEVQEGIKTKFLSQRQNETYENKVQEWIASGNITIDRDAIKD